MVAWSRAYLSRVCSYARSFWLWLRAFPAACVGLVSYLLRNELRRVVLVSLGVLAACLALAWMGTGKGEIWAIVTTLALAALVVGASQEHRTVGTVVVTVLGLCLVGTLAGPRWYPRPLDVEVVLPSTADTSIGGGVATTPVGTYTVRTLDVVVAQADGSQASARLRLPVGAGKQVPGVVFMHGAGTHGLEGFSEQAQSLASAGVATLVPAKPERSYTLTDRDYVAMSQDYATFITYLRGVSALDPERVGVYAESEGAFPGVIATAQDPDIAFLVLASAPVVRLRQQVALAADSYLRRVGVPDQLLTLIPRLLGAPTLPGGAFGYVDFDASSYVRRIKVPVLMVYGANDDSMPLLQGPYTLSRGMRGNGNDQLTVRYYKAANHGLKLGTSTQGALAPGVSRDLSRWVLGLPGTARAEPRVAGARPQQEFWAQTPAPTRWYASGDLMLGTLVAGFGLIALAGLGWLLGQAPRLRGRPGLHVPDPLGRMSAGACLSVLATWALYLAYLAALFHLARTREVNLLVSYGGILVAQLAGLGTVVIVVRLSRQVWLRRARLGQGVGKWPPLSPAATAVLVCAVLGCLMLLVDLSYWGLFPMLA